MTTSASLPDFIDGEYYWLKTRDEGWQIGKCSRYVTDGEHINFEQPGVDWDRWEIYDFTAAIHIPYPNNHENLP